MLVAEDEEVAGRQACMQGGRQSVGLQQLCEGSCRRAPAVPTHCKLINVSAWAFLCKVDVLCKADVLFSCRPAGTQPTPPAALQRLVTVSSVCIIEERGEHSL